MKPFCQAVAPIALAIEEVGAEVVSILAVAIEEVDGSCLLDHSDPRFVSSCSLGLTPMTKLVMYM